MKPVRPTTRYLNADFDLSLRPRPEQVTHAILQRQTRELTALTLLGADERDTALVRVGIPDAYLEYLAGCGLTLPDVRMHPHTNRSTTLAPFGWNAETAELNLRHHLRADHPSLDCVRGVNGREFSLQLERELFPGPSNGTLVKSEAELEAALSCASCESEWIVKSEHGNAGLGNRRLRSRALTDADRRFVRARLREDDQLLIEPYHKRIRDWAMILDVPFDAARLRIHETVCTRDGGMIGAVFDSDTAADFRQDDRLTGAAERIAQLLERAGYFGPACVDGYSHGENRCEVRPLCDLNCRLALSDSMFRLRQRLAPERTVYFRFFSWNKLRLPERLPEIVSELSDAAYDPGKRSGILLGSPPRLAGPDHGEPDGRPLKLALLFFATDKAAAFALERRFRKGFEATK